MAGVVRLGEVNSKVSQKKPGARNSIGGACQVQGSALILGLEVYANVGMREQEFNNGIVAEMGGLVQRRMAVLVLVVDVKEGIFSQQKTHSGQIATFHLRKEVLNRSLRHPGGCHWSGRTSNERRRRGETKKEEEEGG